MYVVLSLSLSLYCSELLLGESTLRGFILQKVRFVVICGKRVAFAPKIRLFDCWL